MPTILQTNAVLAGATVDNTLTGSSFLYLPYNALVRFGLVSSGNPGDFRVDVSSGQDILMENGIVSAQNRVPIDPDDYTLSDVAAAGELLKVRPRNTTAGTLNFFTAVQVTPL